MLITPHYKEMNRLFNEKNDWSSASLPQVASIVLNVSNEVEAGSILDYGSGKRHLENMMAKALRPGVFRSYDPGVPGIDTPAEPADVVVCNAVLEHIEPECLEDVLDDLRRCTRHTALLIISTYPSGVTLADGTSPHKIVENANWWLPHLIKRWKFKRGDDTKQFFFRGLAV